MLHGLLVTPLTWIAIENAAAYFLGGNSLETRIFCKDETLFFMEVPSIVIFFTSSSFVLSPKRITIALKPFAAAAS